MRSIILLWSNFKIKLHVDENNCFDYFALGFNLYVRHEGILDFVNNKINNGHFYALFLSIRAHSPLQSHTKRNQNRIIIIINKKALQERNDRKYISHTYILSLHVWVSLSKKSMLSEMF